MSSSKTRIFYKKYENYIKIFIIRNPLFVFSSLNKRYDHYELSDYHSIEKYISILKLFIKYENNPEKNIYTIKYEDLFQNNYNELKKILDDIGFQYNDDIFTIIKYKNEIISGTELLDKKPPNKDHSHYRTWQINQQFICQNDISKIDLTDSQKEKIVNDPYVLKLYPDINS